MEQMTYICDRCGEESSTPMVSFVCEFGLVGSEVHRGPDLCTGDLCRKCEKLWAEKFFNLMAMWIEGENEKSINYE